MLYVGMPLEKEWKLQLMQNAAARLLEGASKFQHMTLILQELHWLPIAICAQLKTAGFDLKSPKWLRAMVPEGASPPAPSGLCDLLHTEGLPSCPDSGEDSQVGILCCGPVTFLPQILAISWLPHHICWLLPCRSRPIASLCRDAKGRTMAGAMGP